MKRELELRNKASVENAWRLIQSENDLRYCEWILICGNPMEAAAGALVYEREAKNREEAFDLLGKQLASVRRKLGERHAISPRTKRTVLMSGCIDPNADLNDPEAVCASNLTEMEENHCVGVLHDIKSRHGLFRFDCWGVKRGYEPWAVGQEKARLQARAAPQRPLEAPELH